MGITFDQIAEVCGITMKTLDEVFYGDAHVPLSMLTVFIAFFGDEYVLNIIKLSPRNEALNKLMGKYNLGKDWPNGEQS